MQDKIIRFCYRKIIDANANKPWEKYVWKDTYKEFLMQAQLYNSEKKYNLYSELLHNVRGADKLPFLISATMVGHLKQLNGIVPDITNASGILFLPFKNYKFEMIESDITNKAAHTIAVNFISEPVTWLDTINGMLLLSLHQNKDVNDDALLTELVTLQPFLSIFSLQKEMA